MNIPVITCNLRAGNEG